MQPLALWHGTHSESIDFLQALARHCACKSSFTDGGRLIVCGPHHMLRNQRALDGLLFARRIHSQLFEEEWS
ncbi:MAG TPA: hypothetical protein VF937_07920 [Chloroflexota bacterium]